MRDHIARMSFTRTQYALLLTIIVLWAGNVIAIKYAVMELPPVTAATLRFFLACLPFIPFVQWPGKKQFWTILQISFLMNVLHIGLMFIGLRMLDAASVAVLLQTQVIFATIMGWLFFKETIRWRTWTGIGVAVLGVIVMIGEPDILNNPAGIAIMLCSTLALAFSYVRMKHLQTVHPATYICFFNLLAVPFLFAASLIIEPGSWATLPSANWHVLAPVYIYQAFIITMTHIWWQRLMHAGDIGRLSAYSLMIPFLAVIMSVAILGEELHWPMIAGGILTMAGVGIITLRRIQKGLE